MSVGFVVDLESPFDVTHEWKESTSRTWAPTAYLVPASVIVNNHHLLYGNMATWRHGDTAYSTI